MSKYLWPVSALHFSSLQERSCSLCYCAISPSHIQPLRFIKTTTRPFLLPRKVAIPSYWWKMKKTKGKNPIIRQGAWCYPWIPVKSRIKKAKNAWRYAPAGDRTVLSIQQGGASAGGLVRNLAKSASKTPGWLSLYKFSIPKINDSSLFAEK